MRALRTGSEDVIRAIAAVLVMLALSQLALPQPAHAQLVGENAVNSAGDAFGTSVGVEQTGIYSENDARGFSPKKAGNVRIDGIYFDQVSSISGRLKQSSAIRVGFAAEDYPFHAPTGIVDHKFRPMPAEFGTSFGIHRTANWGSIGEWDVRVPVVKDRIGLTGGMAYADTRQADGVDSFSWGVTVRPIVRFGRVEIAPFYHHGWFPRGKPMPFIVVNGDQLPQLPPVRHYLGVGWARPKFNNESFGGTLKAAITDRLSLRGGMFRSGGSRIREFTEVFLLQPDAVQARHLFIASPPQDVHSTSGEAQLAWRFASGRVKHRLIAGYRARDRITKSGGTDVKDFGLLRFGDVVPVPEPGFSFGPNNEGRLKQSSWLLGYTGRIEGVGLINLGLQKARYRAASRDGATGIVTRSRDDPWLYNATLGIQITPSLSLYAGTEKGLEDSGSAPENAANANEQLPSTRSSQYEGGVRWKFNGGQLVVSAFQISKPYFAFDTAIRTANGQSPYVQLGTVRHRGIETSLSGHFGKRLNLLAGAVLMQPRVSGSARDRGIVGERPAGTPSLYARIDANYRTDLLGGLTPTLGFIYSGSRAAGSSPQASLGGKQLMVPGHATVDFGVRQQVNIGTVPASFRAVLHNAFDAGTWKVAAANTLTMEERRHFALSLAADF